MCGIAGYLHPAFAPDECPRVTRRMLAMIAHRGPDEAGYYFDETASIGAVRLAVVDQPGGTQPFADERGRYWIAYNGEVYNFEELREDLIAAGRRFLSRSDTEVVLQAWMQWGAAAFERFNGGFALAVYDRESRDLWLARDRWGKRPLYYATRGRTFLFASELKAFLEYPGFEFRLNGAELAAAFALWTLLPDQTGFDNVHQLPTGSYLVAGDGGQRLASYAPLEFEAPPFSGSEEEAAKLTRDHLTRSVRLRLRADVPVGTYLSGGLDSSIVTLLAARQSARTVHTFSVGFTDEGFDESAEQDLVSRHLGTHHTRLPVSSREIGAAFPDAVWHAETPVFRTAFVPMFLLSTMVRAQGIEVVLTGEGSDEVFLGYDIFRETLLRRRWHGMTEAGRHEALAALYAYQPHFSGANVRALSAVFAEYSRNAEADLFSHAMRFSNSTLAARLLREGDAGLPALTAWIDRDRSAFERLGPIGKAQWLECVTLLAGYLLSTQGDRMAFAHGVENRCPFLDLNVARWAASLPIEMRLRHMTQEKFILKQAFKHLLPPEIVDRRKRPYVAPDAASFIGASKPEYVDDMTSRAALERLGVVNVDLALRLAKKVLASSPDGVSPRESQAFISLLSLLFLNRFFVKRDYSPPPDPATFVRTHDGRR